jgi:hypothetical protein
MFGSLCIVVCDRDHPDVVEQCQDDHQQGINRTATCKADDGKSEDKDCRCRDTVHDIGLDAGEDTARFEDSSIDGTEAGLSQDQISSNTNLRSTKCRGIIDPVSSHTSDQSKGVAKRQDNVTLVTRQHSGKTIGIPDELILGFLTRGISNILPGLNVGPQSNQPCGLLSNIDYVAECTGLGQGLGVGIVLCFQKGSELTMISRDHFNGNIGLVQRFDGMVKVLFPLVTNETVRLTSGLKPTILSWTNSAPFSFAKRLRS